MKEADNRNINTILCAVECCRYLYAILNAIGYEIKIGQTKY